MLEFNKMSKPLMEKKRRARINNSLEELKTLLEKHYSYNVRKRKLEKADILELTVKHIENLLSMRQEGMALVDQEGITEYKEGFQGCLTKLSTYIMSTKTSQEKLGLMLVDHLNALDPQTHDGPLHNIQVPPSPMCPEKSKIFQPTYHLTKNNTRNLESGNSQRKPSAENSSFGEARRGQQVLTQHVHVASSSSSSPSYPDNLQPPNPCQSPTNSCWRPW